MGVPMDDRAPRRLPPLGGDDLVALAGIRHVAPVAEHVEPEQQYTEPLAVVIPAPRPAAEPATEALTVVRHVVMPPHVERPAPARRAAVPMSGRWGLVLGSVVVTICTTYIAVVGLGLGEERPRGTTSGALSGPTAATAVVSATPSGPSAAAPTPTPARRVIPVAATPSRAAAPVAAPSTTRPAPSPTSARRTTDRSVPRPGSDDDSSGGGDTGSGGSTSTGPGSGPGTGPGTDQGPTPGGGPPAGGPPVAPGSTR